MFKTWKNGQHYEKHSCFKNVHILYNYYKNSILSFSINKFFLIFLKIWQRKPLIEKSAWKCTTPKKSSPSSWYSMKWMGRPVRVLMRFPTYLRQQVAGALLYHAYGVGWHINTHTHALLGQCSLALYTRSVSRLATSSPDAAIQCSSLAAPEISSIRCCLGIATIRSDVSGMHWQNRRGQPVNLERTLHDSSGRLLLPN